MGLATSSELYKSTAKLLQRALDAENGLGITFGSLREAEKFRFDCYNCRNADRKTMEKVYPKGEPLHGISSFDKLRISITKVVEILEDGKPVDRWLAKVWKDTGIDLDSLNIKEF